MNRILVAIVLATLATAAAALDAGRYAIVKVYAIDGDTVRGRIADTGEIVTVRLVGVDAPETARAQCAAERRAGLEAKAFANQWLSRRGALTLAAKGRDKYHRVLGRVSRGDDDLSAALLAAGHARPYGGGRRAGWC